MDDRTAGASKASALKPMTGAEYLDELRDGREVYIYGERVKDPSRLPQHRPHGRPPL
jgi:4-hydroxyphenylacetate 3-monooxygenase